MATWRKVIVSGSNAELNHISSSGNFVPVETDGGALGSAGLNWSDLFLDSGAVVNFDNGVVTLTHASNKLTVDGGDVVFGSGFDISGSFTNPSASFSTRITTEEGNVDTLQSRNLTAGTGLTGGGDLTSDRTFNVVGGTGITANADDIAIDFSDSTFKSAVSGSFQGGGSNLISGSATSTGSFAS